MQTIKTAVVVVLLLGVCYGAWVALNTPEPTLPGELADWENDIGLQVDSGAAVDIPQLSQNGKANGLDSLSPPNVIPPLNAGPANPGAVSPGADSLKNSSPNKPDTSSLAGSASPPTLALPNSPNDIVNPPALSLPGTTDNKPSDNKIAGGLGNDVPKLPDFPKSDTDIPAGIEGASVPLPGNLVDTKTNSNGLELPKLIPPSSVADSSNNNSASNGLANGGLSLPPVPAIPGSANNVPPAGDLPPLPIPSGPDSLAGQPKEPTSAASIAPKTGGSARVPFATAREKALELTRTSKLLEALTMMSPYYNSIELTHEEQLDLNDLLDALTGEVIYSKRHFLEPRYMTSSGDTLDSIAAKYHVSPELLASINQIGESRIVTPGTELKVFKGPFRGEVDLSKGELTLFLGELYAGRFPVAVGSDPAPQEGKFSIVEKRRDRPYTDKQFNVISPKDPTNPYGGYWMHLGNNVSIHGSAEKVTPELEHAGCISLAPLDAREIYSLLSQGAEVVIRP